MANNNIFAGALVVKFSIHDTAGMIRHAYGLPEMKGKTASCAAECIARCLGGRLTEDGYNNYTLTVGLAEATETSSDVGDLLRPWAEYISGNTVEMSADGSLQTREIAGGRVLKPSAIRVL